MPLQLINSSIFRGLSLSIGMAFLLGNGSAVALPRIPSSANLRVAQATPPSVIVDTEEPGTTGGSTTTPTTTTNSNTRFSCQSINGQYTVVYQPESQPNQAFPWAAPSELGGGWNSQRRCNEISRRLESYRPDGLLELTTSVENNYNTVCVTTEQVPGCRIVFTVPPGQDPVLTRDRVFENLTIADSGQQTDAVYTYRDRNQGLSGIFNTGREILGGRNQKKSINLKPFLDKSDGGTGTQLRRGVPAQKPSSSPAKPSNNDGKGRLNPGSFR